MLASRLTLLALLDCLRAAVASRRPARAHAASGRMQPLIWEHHL